RKKSRRRGAKWPPSSTSWRSRNRAEKRIGSGDQQGIAMTLLLKDPDAVLDYSIDWGAEYLLGTDLIADSQWSVVPDEPDGVSVAGSDFDATTSTVKAA